MKTVGLLVILAGFVMVWGIGYKGLDFSQLQADIQSWVFGGPTVSQAGNLQITPLKPASS